MKRVTIGGAHLRGLVPEQLRSEETPRWWRAVGDTVSDLTEPGFEPQSSGTNDSVFATELTSFDLMFIL